jgi:hypothetical protein
MAQATGQKATGSPGRSNTDHSENMSSKSEPKCNYVIEPGDFLPRFREKGSFDPMVCRLNYPLRRTTFITHK